MEVLRFSTSNVVKIRNGIMFDFYLGLPHMFKMVLPYPLLVSVPDPKITSVDHFQYSIILEAIYAPKEVWGRD